MERGVLGAGESLEMRFQSPVKTGYGSGNVAEIVRGWGTAREKERHKQGGSSQTNEGFGGECKRQESSQAGQLCSGSRKKVF